LLDPATIGVARSAPADCPHASRALVRLKVAALKLLDHLERITQISLLAGLAPSAEPWLISI
jgi:hypothetical protein